MRKTSCPCNQLDKAGAIRVLEVSVLKFLTQGTERHDMHGLIVSDKYANDSPSNGAHVLYPEARIVEAHIPAVIFPFLVNFCKIRLNLKKDRHRRMSAM